jgi:hypothetical protein
MSNNIADNSDLTVHCDVPDNFMPYIESAVIRLRYLHDDFTFQIKNNQIIASPNSQAETSGNDLLRSINHQLYRERIYAETLTIRNWFYVDD